MSRIYKQNDAVAGPITITGSHEFNSYTVAVNYYSDAALTTPVTPSAGTLAVTGRVPCAGGNYTFSDSPITATTVSDYASASTPLDQIVVTPSGIAGASYYKVTVTTTKS